VNSSSSDPFIVEFPPDVKIREAISAISKVSDLSKAQIEQQLRTYLGESQFAQSVISRYLPDKPARILEVGGGIGWVSRALSRTGYDVSDLEPSGQGFGFMSAAREALSDGHSAQHLEIGVDELSPVEHGTFDLVYSINVLEHVPDPISALSRMYQALAPHGQVVIMCPNYSFPFEPHFSVPLVPFSPSSTEHLLPQKITGSELWGSLNWITAKRVKRWAAETGALVEFDNNVLRHVFDRITKDPIFEERHTVISKLTRLLDRIKALEVLAATPPTLVSPMQFVISRPSK